MNDGGGLLLLFLAAGIGAFFVWASAGGYDSFLPGHRLKGESLKREREDSKNIFIGVFIFIVFIGILAISG
jgi:hypothetical protein